MRNLKAIFTLILVFMISPVCSAQVSPGGVKLSDYYQGRQDRTYQCFMSRTNPSNPIMNSRQSFEFNIGPTVEFFRSEQSVRFGYKPGAVTWGDATFNQLIKPLSAKVGFRRAGEKSVFVFKFSRRIYRLSDSKFVFYEQVENGFLRRGANLVFENPDQSFAWAGVTENPGLRLDPKLQGLPNELAMIPGTIRGPLHEARQTFENGDSYYLACNMCSKGFAGSWKDRSDFEKTFDPEHFSSAGDAQLKNTYLEHFVLDFE